MAMPITLSGSASEAGRPVALFTLAPASESARFVGSEYAASRDGQKFLVSKIVKEASPVTVLLNWKPKP